LETDYRGFLGEGTVSDEQFSVPMDWNKSDPWQMTQLWEQRWKALEEWLSQARGRDYVTRTPAVVLQKMRDLMGDES